MPQAPPDHPTGRDPAPDPLASLLRRVGPPLTPALDREARVRQTVRRTWLRGVQRRRRRRVLTAGALAAAAGLVLLVQSGRLPPAPAAGRAATGSAPRRVATLLSAVGQVLDATSGAALPIGSDLFAGTALTTGPGVRAALSMGLGRTVRIDQASRLRLETPDRLWLEAGAVYVDSPPAAAAHPLHLATALGEAVEEGTRFEVRASAALVSLRVRDGRVALQRGAETVRVERAGQLDLSAAGTVERRVLSPTDPSWAWTWRTGLSFAIEGAPLDAFLAWHAAESGRATRLADVATRAIVERAVLHGSVTGLTPDEALVVACRTSGLAVVADGDGWVVSRGGR